MPAKKKTKTSPAKRRRPRKPKAGDDAPVTVEVQAIVHAPAEGGNAAPRPGPSAVGEGKAAARPDPSAVGEVEAALDGEYN